MQILWLGIKTLFLLFHSISICEPRSMWQSRLGTWLLFSKCGVFVGSSLFAPAVHPRPFSRMLSFTANFIIFTWPWVPARAQPQRERTEGHLSPILLALEISVPYICSLCLGTAIEVIPGSNLSFCISEVIFVMCMSFMLHFHSFYAC